MTDAEIIFKMIETVDPADTAKLDEIDARVWCWLNNKIFLRINVDRPAAYAPTYTRSRNTLKSSSIGFGQGRCVFCQNGELTVIIRKRVTGTQPKRELHG